MGWGDPGGRLFLVRITDHHRVIAGVGFAGMSKVLFEGSHEWDANQLTQLRDFIDALISLVRASE